MKTAIIIIAIVVALIIFTLYHISRAVEMDDDDFDDPFSFQ